MTQRQRTGIEPPSRRRFIAIAGAVAGCALLPGAARADAPVHRWRGTALGAAASIQLACTDRAAARRLIEAAVGEIARLEAVFSLHATGSALSRLNRDGAIDGPPLALVELLARATAVSRATGGVFDVTVQPLWRRYAGHFSHPHADPAGPRLDDVLPLVDWRALDLDAARIAFRRPGMAATLNGIAQGYITDRVAELLRRNGVDRVLLDLGETRALGGHPEGRPWSVGIADPTGATPTVGRLGLADGALATSGGYGTLLEPGGRFTHLIDPRSGATARPGASVTVLAPDATTADALSTALALMDEDAMRAVARQFPGARVLVADSGGLRQVSA